MLETGLVPYHTGFRVSLRKLDLNIYMQICILEPLVAKRVLHLSFLSCNTLLCASISQYLLAVVLIVLEGQLPPYIQHTMPLECYNIIKCKTE